MKILRNVLACLTAFSLILILMVTAAEAALYRDFGFYEKEYKKYDVLDELEMEMEDVMVVTREMMSYLHDRREDLTVYTIVDGEEREFFNDREKAHMTDVKKLFDAGIKIRYMALVIFLISVLMLMRTGKEWKKRLSGYCIAGILFSFVLAGSIGYLAVRDFNKYFVRFHEIFFDNDLWILNPKTDLLIRMLPESFFFDFAVRIGVFISVTMIAFFLVNVWIYRKKNKK